MIKKSVRRGALLGLMPRNKEKSSADVKVDRRDHCGCSDHVMVEIRILRKEYKANSKTIIT